MTLIKICRVFGLALIMLGLLSLSFYAVPGAKAQEKVIRYGTMHPLTGAYSVLGRDQQRATELAVSEWNAKGGVLGMKIEPVVEDSQCEADPAVNAANKVVDQDKVHYIVGEVCSKASIPISEIATEKNIVQISPTSTNVQVTKKVDGTTRPTVFRACFIDPFQGAAMAGSARGAVGPNTCAAP